MSTGLERRGLKIAAGAMLLALLLCGHVLAAKALTLTAGCPSRCAEKITARNNKRGMLLSVPGFWDLSAVTLELSNSEKVQLRLGKEKQEAAPGQTVDLSGLKEGQRIEVLDAKNRSVGYLTVVQGSQIPALFLEVDGEELKKIHRSKKNEIHTGRAAYYEADGQVSYDGELAQLKCRGNITFAFPKKPYQFKLAKKASLSGMNKDKTWILLSNWTDLSLLRNQIMLDMSREIGLRYAVSCEQADVWINGAYYGLFLLTEKVQVGKGRVDITDLEEATEEVNGGAEMDPGELEKKKHAGYKLFRSYPAVKDPEDITGGYIMTIEKNHRMQTSDVPGFRTQEMLNIRIREPDYPSTAQTEYLGQLITEMQHALLAKDGISPESGKSYEEYVDVHSFAQKFLLEDWCKNYDFLGGSQYIYKDSDKVDPLIYAGPAWDYDLAFGNMRDKGHLSTGKYLINFKQDNNIYWILYKHDAFKEKIREVWQGAFRPAAAVLLGEAPAREGGVLRSYDEYRERIAASAAMNFKRWGYNKATTAYESGGSFERANSYLKKWIREHTEAMDKLYGADAAAGK